MDFKSVSHDSRIGLSDEPRQHADVFRAAFNSGEPDAGERVYEDVGILVPHPGQPIGGTARAAGNAKLVDLGVPIDVRPRHVYVADDIALLIVDWSITGTSRSGDLVDISGTATDVARRGADGKWRYVIDNPFGTA